MAGNARYLLAKTNCKLLPILAPVKFNMDEGGASALAASHIWSFYESQNPCCSRLLLFVIFKFARMFTPKINLFIHTVHSSFIWIIDDVTRLSRVG